MIEANDIIIIARKSRSTANITSGDLHGVCQRQRHCQRKSLGYGDDYHSHGKHEGIDDCFDKHCTVFEMDK